MIRQLAHLNFVTDDLPAIIHFYTQQLGLEVKFTLKNAQGLAFGYYFGCGNTTFLEFFDQTLAAQQWGGSAQTLTAGTRYQHFCLEVTGLEACCERLRASGVEVSPISAGLDNSRQAWVSDPDGNLIELMEYGPQSLQLTGN